MSQAMRPVAQPASSAAAPSGAIVTLIAVRRLIASLLAPAFAAST